MIEWCPLITKKGQLKDNMFFIYFPLTQLDKTVKKTYTLNGYMLSQDCLVLQKHNNGWFSNSVRRLNSRISSQRYSRFRVSFLWACNSVFCLENQANRHCVERKMKSVIATASIYFLQSVETFWDPQDFIWCLQSVQCKNNRLWGGANNSWSSVYIKEKA